MGQGIFIANIIGSLPELGDDFASKNWGDFAATLVDDIAQGALLYIQNNGSEHLKELVETTFVLEVALLAVESMSVLNGFGEEDDGTRFEAARAFFGTADEALKFATPDDHWEGTASETYAGKNVKQRTRVQDLVELDRSIKEILENEAHTVADTRNFLGIWKGVITASIFVAMALSYMPWAGPQASFAFQVAVAFAAITACASKEVTTVTSSGKYARQVNDVTAKYRALAEEVKQQPDWSIQPEVPAAAETTVSSFEAISSGLSGSSAIPETAGLAGAAGGFDNRRTALSARTGAGEAPAGGAPGVTADATTPATPAFTTPPVAQPPLPWQQAAKLSAVPQVASKRRHDQASSGLAGTVAAEEAAPAGALPTVGEPAGGIEGAGAGAQAAERAPLEGAVGERAQELGSLPRSA